MCSFAVIWCKHDTQVIELAGNAVDDWLADEGEKKTRCFNKKKLKES
jgi:hypothetical protein